MNSENYSQLKKMILVEILSDKTTLELSTLIGFKFDKYRRWLNDEKILRWDEFEYLCLKSGLDLAGALAKIVPQSFVGRERLNLFSTLKDWNRFKTNNEVALFLNCHISVIKRYSTNETDPDIETILKLIGAKGEHLTNFLRELFSNEIKSDELNKWMDDKYSNKSTAIASNPLIGIIRASLALERYKSKTIPTDLWLSELLDIKLEEIQDILVQMISLNLLINENDIYRVTVVEVNLEGFTFKDHIPRLEYATFKYLEHLNKRKDPNYDKESSFAGINCSVVFAANEDAMREINDIILNAYNEIYKVFNKSTAETMHTEVRFVSLNTFGIAK